MRGNGNATRPARGSNGSSQRIRRGARWHGPIPTPPKSHNLCADILGRLAADFGPGYLEQDRASRLFLYRGRLTAEWQAYDGDAEATCIAFVAGINAYIDLIQAKPDRLPLEFVRM